MTCMREELFLDNFLLPLFAPGVQRPYYRAMSAIQCHVWK